MKLFKRALFRCLVRILLTKNPLGIFPAYFFPDFFPNVQAAEKFDTALHGKGRMSASIEKAILQKCRGSLNVVLEARQPHGVDVGGEVYIFSQQTYPDKFPGVGPAAMRSDYGKGRKVDGDLFHVSRMGIVDGNAGNPAGHEHDGNMMFLSILIHRVNTTVIGKHGKGMCRKRLYIDASKWPVQNFPIHDVESRSGIKGINAGKSGKPSGPVVHDGTDGFTGNVAENFAESSWQYAECYAGFIHFLKKDVHGEPGHGFGLIHAETGRYACIAL